MYYIIFVALGVSGVIQYFIKGRWLKKILAITGLVSFLGLGVIGYFDGSRVNDLQDQSQRLEAAVVLATDKVVAWQATSSNLEAQITRLQGQIKKLNAPQKDALYNPSGNIVARMLISEIPGQDVLKQYDGIKFSQLCDVTQINPGEIIVIYPYGQPIKMQLVGSSTVMAHPGLIQFVADACSSSVVNITFRFVKK